VVENAVVLDVKAVETVTALHLGRLLTLLKLSHKSAGLLINFDVVHLRDGIKEMINDKPGISSRSGVASASPVI
jgi:GxxExxY protein